MAKFHTLQVAEVRRETADCVSVSFDVPAQLKAEYQYIQGQYLTLKLVVNGEELRRSYSLCSSPVADSEWRIAIKKVKDGKGSRFINDTLKAGDKIEVMTPMGNFYTPLNASNKKNYVLFAGGSGITPMLSIIKTILQTEPSSTLQLFYGNRDEASAIFKNVIDQLVASNPLRLQVVHVMEEPSNGSEELYRGMLTREKTTDLLHKHLNQKR